MTYLDRDYMEMALSLAAKAEGRTSPNPMVGAVIVKDGEMVGRGYHKKAGTPHAEVHALNEAGEKSQGATMYVTLEPCSHYGRTPPCSQAVIKAGLKRVVVAMEDPNPLVAGRGIQQMREAGIEVMVGVCEAESKKLNEVFIKYIKYKKPFVLIKSAMTLDGKIATSTGYSRWVTGPEARKLVHRWRSYYDAILVGIGTVLVDDPKLNCRLEDEPVKNPVRIILDSKGRIPLNAKVLNTDEAPTIIVGTEKMPIDKRKAIEQKGAEVLILDDKQGYPNLGKLMDELAKRELSSLFVEGGAMVNASFLNSRLADKFACFIAPKIVGGQNAPGPVGEMGILKMDDAFKLQNLSVEKVGDDILLVGYLPNVE